jgi:hypothetical protein
MGTSAKALRARAVVAGSCFEALEARQLLAFSAFVNFQPQGTQTPSGYRADTGAVFGSRGAGLSYGWNAANNNAIDRNSSLSPDQRYDTFAQMQVGGNFTWELAVPVGTYNVRLSMGDPVSNDAFYHLFAEGRQMVNGVPSTAQRWIGANNVVNVTDGRLTITSGANAVNNKINFIEVTKATPAVPSQLVATALSATQIRLNWQDNSINEDGFVVERALYSGNMWQSVGTLNPNVTTFTDVNLIPSTQYKYRVKSFNDVGSSYYYSNSASAATQQIPGVTPAAPSGLSGSAVENVVSLSWTDNSNNEEKFIIERFTYDWLPVKEVPANTTSTTAFASTGTFVPFRVIARNSAGGSSDPSAPVTVAIRAAQPYGGAQAVSSSAIDIAWDSVDSCQFNVQRLDGSEWVTIAENLLSLNYRDTNLPPGTQQSYRVIAVNPAGNSEPSFVMTATTAPAAVTGLAVTNVTTSSVSLRWNDVTGEAGYMVERSLDGVTWTLVTNTFANVTTHNVTGLQAATTYRFRVTGFAYGLILGDRGDVVLATTLGGTDDRLSRLVLT